MAHPDVLQRSETELPYGFETVPGMENTHRILRDFGILAANDLISTYKEHGELMTIAPISGSMIPVYFTLQSLYENLCEGTISDEEHKSICASFTFIDIKNPKSENPTIYPEDLPRTSKPIKLVEDVGDTINTLVVARKFLSTNGDATMDAAIFKDIGERTDDIQELINESKFSSTVKDVWIWSGCGMNRGVNSPEQMGTVMEAYLTALQRVCTVGVSLQDGSEVPSYFDQLNYFSANMLPEFRSHSMLFGRLVQIDYLKSIGENNQAINAAKATFELMRASIEGRTIDESLLQAFETDQRFPPPSSLQSSGTL